MTSNVRFAIISDPHITLPQTLWDSSRRFHLGEISISALENVLDRLKDLNLDFLLMPGDLTQHGEPENHTWLADRLAQLPYPAYVIPGNHDVPKLKGDDTAIGLADFPYYYRECGYRDPTQLYYTHSPLPGVRLIGLNSNLFNAEGKQLGRLDDDQLIWLEQVLAEFQHEFILVMLHHNVVEHLPGQARNPLGQRYMLDNAPTLLKLLQTFGVQLVFTGHLHIQDVAYAQGVYDITTGSLVSYPHPFRVLQVQTDKHGKRWLQIESDRVKSVPGWETLQTTSREHMGARSRSLMLQLLTQPPLNLSPNQVEPLIPSLRYFWADIANGDAVFDFSDLPLAVRHHFERFSAVDQEGQINLVDNHVALLLQ